MKRRIVTFALAAILLAVSLPHASAADTRFPAVRTYAGQFADLDAGAWYYESAAALYELGLINGQDGRFAPDSEMTIAEAVTMAAVPGGPVTVLPMVTVCSSSCRLISSASSWALS